MVQIAVLMTCHNRREKTLLCLKRLFSQLGIDQVFDLKVFLVDDGSSDGTGEAVEELYPDVNIIKGNGNLFWNRGMHLAWSEALKVEREFGIKYHYYLWLNDDTFLLKNAVLTLLDSSEKAGSFAIVCGTTCDDEGNMTYGGFSALNNKLIIPGEEIQECDFFNGNCVFVSKDVCQHVGILDFAFHHALGDFDYGLRAKRLGVKLYVSPSFIGICSAHDNFPAWCSPSTPFKMRIKALYLSSCEINPFQLFLYEKRHYGIFYATKHFFSIHLRASIPSLWFK